jgi:outer membrane protein OmpA-like peptidoglycan-associated protein
VAAATLLAVTACSGGPSTGQATSSTAPTARSGTGVSASEPAPAMPQPVFDQVRSFYGTNTSTRLRLKVYPLQRVAGALLLTVDYTVQNTNGAFGRYWFQPASLRGERVFDLNSLVDTERLVRYAPLAEPGQSGTLSSEVDLGTQSPAVTYRVGGFFPDPGSDVRSMAVDLQQGGMIPAVPISDDTTPPAGLVAGSSPAPAREDLKIWPVHQPGPDAVVTRRDLVAQVAGGTLEEGSGGANGLVTVNADVLFAFDSAALSPRGSALIDQVTSVLAAKADPDKPVSVVGHTDAKGSDGYNQQLSLQRATTVTKALTASRRVTGMKFRSEGHGAKEPVAANTTASGADNPAGRALNRRVEIWYSPKPQASPSPDASPRSTTPEATPASGGTAAGTDGAGQDLPRATVRDSTFSTTVRPVTRDGRLALVNFDVTLVSGEGSLFSALSRFSYSSYDISAVQVTDPATRRVYLPVYDKGDLERILATSMTRMYEGAPYRFSLYVAGVPRDVKTVTVSLGGLGTAAAVPVQG